MQPLSCSLLLLHSDVRFQARVRDAGGWVFTVEPVASWDALVTELRTASLSAIVVADPYTGRQPGDGPAPELRSLIHAFPASSVLAAVDARSRLSDLRTLGEWGVTEVISVEHDDSAAVRHLLLAVHDRPLQSILSRALPPDAGSGTRAIVDAAARIATTGGQAEDLARRFFVSMRTLHRRCEDAGLPPPRQTLAWMRILLAAELLEQPGRSVESVAVACGYACDSGLRRAFYDFLGRSPRELRQAGAFETVAGAFRAALGSGARHAELPTKLTRS